MILVDYSQISIAAIMMELQGRTDVQLNVSMARHMIISSILNIKKKFGREYGELIICCDAKNYWRKKAFPQYKFGRKKSRADSGLDWSSIFECITIVKEELETTFPYPVCQIDGAEADDVVGSLVRYSQTHDLIGTGTLVAPHPAPTLIVSGDADFQQLLKYQDVKQYDPTRKKDMFLAEDPQHLLMEKILKGCRGDCVPCFLNDDDSIVNGERMKSIYKTKFDIWKNQTLDEIASDPDLLKIYPKTFLERNLKRNQQLVDLSFIPQELQDEIVQNYLNQRGQRNRSQLMNYFVKNGMNQMVEKMGDF